jgi:hypothetical protein
VCSKKGYGYKWNQNERLSNFALRHKLVRKDMDINEHMRLSKFTLKTQIQLSNSL